MKWMEMDRVSQGMIDGCSNYISDPVIAKNCDDCTRSIDLHIDAQLKNPKLHNAPSLLSSQLEAGMSIQAIKANIKLAISGGQNEPRDAIAGTIGTLLENRSQLEMIISGTKTWLQAFEEYARWMSPIGMSPRRIAKKFIYKNVEFYENDMIFFMFGSANRDEAVFENPDYFDISRDNGPSIAFGAGPHFCAGSWISKTLIAEVALPLFFSHFPNVYLKKPIKFQGWAFRGPKEVILENSNK
jgi:cytochrome P450